MEKIANAPQTGFGVAGMPEPSLGIQQPTSPMMGQEQPQNRNFIPSDNKEGNEQNLFETAFKDMAYDVFSSKFPELTTEIVTFKILESDVEKGLAIGAFIINYRTETIYVPVVLFEDTVKPIEMMYSKRLDKFLPLKQEWLDVLISSNEASLGKAVTPPDGLASDVDIRKLVAPPIAGRYGYASDKNVSFVDYLKDAKHSTKLAFAKLLKNNKDFLKFAFENFSKRDLYNSLIEKGAQEPDKHSAGMTEVVVVDNNTPLPEIKAVFKDKAPEAMKMIAREGFAVKDDRVSYSKPYAVETRMKFERPTEPGVYRIYLSDGTMKNAFIFPQKDEIMSGSGMGDAFGYHGQHCGVVILENGDYYCKFGVCTPLNPNEFTGKVADIIYGEKSDTPKANSKILFVRNAPGKLSMYGPFEVNEIVTETDGTKKFIRTAKVYNNGKEESKPVETIVYKDTPTKNIMGPKDCEAVKIIPTTYKIITLGNQKNYADLLKNEKDVLRYIQDKILMAGAEKVKISDAGFGEYSVNGKVAEDKKATLLNLVNKYNIKADLALEKVNQLTVPGDKVEFFVINKESEEKLGSIFQGTADASQLQPSQAAMMQQPMMDPSMMGQPPMMDPSMMDPSMMQPQFPEMEQLPSELMTDAMQLNNPELFDIGAVASLAGTVSVKDLITIYIPHLEKALDSIARIILTFWMQGEKVKNELGTVTHQTIEDKLRNIFSNLGELILKLGKNTLLLKREGE